MKIYEIKLHWELVSCQYLNLSSIGKGLKKVVEKLGISPKQKFPIFSMNIWKIAWLERRLWKLNNLTYSKPWGISGKRIFISFIRHPLVLSVTTGLATVRVGNTRNQISLQFLRTLPLVRISTSCPGHNFGAKFVNFGVQIWTFLIYIAKWAILSFHVIYMFKLQRFS